MRTLKNCILQYVRQNIDKCMCTDDVSDLNDKFQFSIIDDQTIILFIVVVILKWFYANIFDRLIHLILGWAGLRTYFWQPIHVEWWYKSLLIWLELMALIRFLALFFSSLCPWLAYGIGGRYE